MTNITAQTFTKDDFKRASDLVGILGNKYDEATIERTMHELLRKRVTITVNNLPRPIIYSAKWNHSNKAGTHPALRLHPLGLEKFQEYLEKGK